MHARAEIVVSTLSASIGAFAGGETNSYSFFLLDFWDGLQDFLYG